MPRTILGRGAWLLALLLTACPRHPPAEPAADPVAALAAARAEAWTAPSMGRFSIRLGLPDQNVAASGLVILAPPARFRFEIRGPVGGPAVVVASDGATLDAWIAGKNQIWHGPDADVALRGLSGGLVGLDAVVSLLGGRLPASEGWVAGPGGLLLMGPGGARVDVVLEERTAHLLSLDARDAAGQPVLSAQVLPEPEGPRELAVQIPRLGVSAQLGFERWEPYEPSEAVFRIPTPEGAEVHDFGELLEQER